MIRCTRRIGRDLCDENSLCTGWRRRISGTTVARMATKAANPSSLAIAMAFAGRSARACHVCAYKSALWYCAADEAYLCTACDTQVHSANALSLRHERVRLAPNGTPKKGALKCSLVPEDASSRKRARATRPYWHHLRKLTRLSNELVESKEPTAELELDFDFLDADEFAVPNDGNQEVPSVSSSSSDEEFLASDLDEFQEGDHTATADSFAAFFKGKAAQSENGLASAGHHSGDQFLVPEAAFGDDVGGVDAPADTDLPGDAFFFPGDIPGLDAFDSFAPPEMDLSDEFAISFDLALQSDGLDAFEGNGDSVTSHMTGTDP